MNRAIAALQDDKTIEAIVSMVMDLQERENTDLPLYEQQLKEAETGINNLLNAIQQGILTPSTKSRLEELEATKEDLEIRIANEKLAKPKLTAEFVTMWLKRLRNLDMTKKEHRQRLIDTFINSVYVYDDKLEYTINCKDGTETITFEEASRALAEQESGSDMESSGVP